MKKINLLLASLSLFALVGCNNKEEEQIYRIEACKEIYFQLSLVEFKYGLPYSSDSNKESITLRYSLHSSFDEIKQLENYLGSYTAVFDGDNTRGGINFIYSVPPSIAPDETVNIDMRLSAFKDWQSFVVTYKSRDINYKFIMNKSDYPNS